MMTESELLKVACRADEASDDLKMISSKLNAISSFFMCENEGIEITLEGESAFGFAWIIQDLAKDIKEIAGRLEGRPVSEEGGKNE